MERNQIIALWLLYRRRRRDRIHWIHPINQRRDDVGMFVTLFEDLRNDDVKFFNYFRMSIASFDELHGRLKEVIQRENSKMRNCIQPVEMVAVTLRLVLKAVYMVYNLLYLLIYTSYK